MGDYVQEPQLIHLKQRLRNEMKMQDMTPAQLARQSGVTEQGILAYLRGIRTPNAVSLIRLSRTLNVSCDWLLGFGKGGDDNG